MYSFTLHQCPRVCAQPAALSTGSPLQFEEQRAIHKEPRSTDWSSPILRPLASILSMENICSRRSIFEVGAKTRESQGWNRF